MGEEILEDTGNNSLSKLFEIDYMLSNEVSDLAGIIKAKNTLAFKVYSMGLFPAAGAGDMDISENTGYQNIWVRDNIYVAFSHLVNGKSSIAVAVARVLLDYFYEYAERFGNVIEGKVDLNDPIERPHVRLMLDTTKNRPQETEEKWAHAQNDALGYFLWFYLRLVKLGFMSLDDKGVEMIALFLLFFKAIRFWEDEDSGHWEEVPKISASSIGTVLAALLELKAIAQHREQGMLAALDEYLPVSAEKLIADLIEAGTDSINKILPFECIQPDKRKKRDYDSALLFLIYPLQVVDGEMADRIIENVERHLLGEHGIKRYQGDSYWCNDYKDHLPPETRTSDFSENMEERDSFLIPGEEAQWCIFDPILSSIYGIRYEKSRSRQDLERQIYFLNRSLSQLTDEDSPFGPYKCPECYYKEKGRYVPNDHTPLLWTQANLWVALHHMETSAKIARQSL